MFLKNKNWVDYKIIVAIILYYKKVNKNLGQKKHQPKNIRLMQLV